MHAAWPTLLCPGRQPTHPYKASPAVAVVAGRGVATHDKTLCSSAGFLMMNDKYIRGVCLGISTGVYRQARLSLQDSKRSTLSWRDYSASPVHQTAKAGDNACVHSFRAHSSASYRTERNDDPPRNQPRSVPSEFLVQARSASVSAHQPVDCGRPYERCCRCTWTAYRERSNVRVPERPGDQPSRHRITAHAHGDGS